MGFKSFLLLLSICFVLTGCATQRKSIVSKEVDELKTRINNLESELEFKNERISTLEKEIGLAYNSDNYRAKDSSKASSRLTSKQIQTTLKNAGFYNGSIDGKIGKMTRGAILEFQKANGLKADGIVGRKTSKALRDYLSQGSS